MMPQVNIAIPTIGTSNYIVDLLDQIHTDHDEIVRNVFVLDNGMPAETLKTVKMFNDVVVLDSHGLGVYEMWNKGVKTSMAVNPNDYIAILNDDLILNAPNYFTTLVEPLDTQEDIWAVCGNWDHRSYNSYYQKWDHFPGTRKDNGFAGFCFAVKGEAYMNKLPLFEERYHVWCGDDDFVASVYKAGKKCAMSIGAKVIHIDGGSNSFGDMCRHQNETNAKDVELYMAKHHSHVGG